MKYFIFMNEEAPNKRGEKIVFFLKQNRVMRKRILIALSLGTLLYLT